MAKSIYFNGELLTIPGAYAETELSTISTKGDNEGAKVIAFVGECTGGEPGAVQFFSNPITAKNTLKSGDLLKACEKAWNPVSKTKYGVSLGGANVIACIRSNEATKSTLNITKDGADKPQLVFSSKDFGGDTHYQLKMQDGSLTGTKKVVIYDQVNNSYETFDDVGNMFTINYTGDQPYAELNVYLDGNKSMYLQTRIGQDADTAQEDINVQLDTRTFKNIRALILHLQSFENYVVSSLNPYNTKLAVTDLDFVTKAEIKFAEGTQAYRLTAVYSDLKSKLENGSQLVELSEFDKSQGEIANFDYTSLTGGDEGKSPVKEV